MSLRIIADAKRIVDAFDDSNYKRIIQNCKTFGHYLPESGQGNTLATQIATAFNKCAYRYYNDGDTPFYGYGCETVGPMYGWLLSDDCPLNLNDCFVRNKYEKWLLTTSELIANSIDQYANSPACGDVYDDRYVIYSDDDDDYVDPLILKWRHP